MMNNRDRLQLLIDSVTDLAIYTLDPEGFIVSWNTGAKNLKGYNSQEIIGQHFSRFFTPEDRAKGLPQKLLEEARAAGRAQSEGWRVRKDGGRFWVSAVLHTIKDSDGKLIGFAKVTRDSTSVRESQQALYESERRFRLLVEGVIDYAIYMLDPNGLIVNWNAGAERMKGYTAGEIIGRHFSHFYTDEDRAAGIPTRNLEIATREGRFETEGWRVRKDGSRFWASAVLDAIRLENGELLGFAKITRDITERRTVQEALRESERQFRLMVQGVTDYGLFMLDANGIVTNWNAGAARIKGYTAEEILGQHFSRFYTEGDRAAGLPGRALQTATREGRYEAEGWRVRKDGSLFWASIVIDAIKDERGELVGFAKITRDITERRAAQIALDEAQAKRSQAQKMEALGELTGGVAHDFNNLLMIVSGHIRMLKKALPQDAKALRSADAIETAVQRGASLTRQLLAFSRRQSLRPTVVSIGERIGGFDDMLSSSLGSLINLVTDIPADIWPIQVDVNEFELALVNMALNARDAMPQGGTITIRAHNAHVLAGDLSPNLEGDFVALTITDTGYGIAPDILPKVFNPFFTTKQAKGSGLGLSQVHGFVHQSGGTITIESELGKGTTLTLYFPRTADMPEQAEDGSVVEPVGRGVALLVEDNPEVAEVSADLLEQLGYRVHTAANAETALEAVEKEEFDLVVSDIVMAGAMDGIGLARAVRARRPDLPVVLVTGYSHAAANADVEFTVMRKPYQLADLSRAAAKAIGEKEQPEPSNLVRLRDVGKRRPK
jgi:PAS domain S-box-containing protein